jgi:hypothetical protein
MDSVPSYDKPEEPGMYMNADETVVSIYHVIEPEDDFYTAARDIFSWLFEAQQRFPDWPRIVYIDIEGHQGERKGFDGDFFEFQQEFMLGAMGPYFTAMDLPLTGPLINPEEQENEVPERLKINTPEDDFEEGSHADQTRTIDLS